MRTSLLLKFVGSTDYLHRFNGIKHSKNITAQHITFIRLKYSECKGVPLFLNNRDRFQGYERVNERVRTKRGHSEGSRAPDCSSPNRPARLVLGSNPI